MNSFTAAQRATHHCDSPDAASSLTSHLLLEENLMSVLFCTPVSHIPRAKLRLCFPGGGSRFPSICLVQHLFNMVQTPFSCRDMVTMKGRPPGRPSLLSKDGLEVYACGFPCQTWLRTNSSLLGGVSARRARPPTGAAPLASSLSTAMQT